MFKDTWAKKTFNTWQESLKNYKEIEKQWIKEAIEFADKYPQHWERSGRLKDYDK